MKEILDNFVRSLLIKERKKYFDLIKHLFFEIKYDGGGNAIGVAFADDDQCVEALRIAAAMDRHRYLQAKKAAEVCFEPGGTGDVGLREGEVAAQATPPPRPTSMPPTLGAPYGSDLYAQTAPDILRKAAQHMQDRAAARDQVNGERSMRRTVDAFNALTGHALSERDGWLLMVVLKMARATNTPTGTPDDFEDMAAYAALAGESVQEKKT